MTIHLIFNAHLDPIWLWPWTAGLDEALATCRNACDRLDAHPDLTFARGEAWVYRQVEECDPALFDRMRGHIDSGRWEIVGGWWIQPDCNFPSGWGFERQIELGKRYFLDRFGSFPRIAYNVDSFGHNAGLPGLLRAAGQDRYVMMRPQEHEMALPARLFRWRGYEDGPEVVVFRIARGYTTRRISLEHIQASLTELPPGIEHTMCFVGVGDHGGGPTEEQIAWCREHEHAIEGHRLVFSTPRRFFDAVADQVATLPLVIGELQQHAIGCYSVQREVKAGVRRAEHLLRQAEIAGAQPAQLEPAWERVCFHHFHDTLGGTCIPSAYRQVSDQLGFAAAVADEAVQHALRRRLNDLPDDPLQRMVFLNSSDRPFEGYLDAEPWLEWKSWGEDWRLLDGEGEPTPFQVIPSEALCGGFPRLLLRARLQPGQLTVVRIQESGRQSLEPLAQAGEDALCNDAGLACTETALEFEGEAPLPLPELQLIEDASDTWSHGIDRYGEEAVCRAEWRAPLVVDSGPLMASWMQEGWVGDSRLQAEWRLYAGEKFAELLLRVHWAEKHRLLKMVLHLPAPGADRLDGIPGGSLERPSDGRELPLRDWMLVRMEGGARLGIVCPHVFAADATPERVRLTLLRSPIMAHHDPHSGLAPRVTIADQGPHAFRFRFFCGEALDEETLEQHALMLQRPPVFADLTRGMPAK